MKLFFVVLGVAVLAVLIFGSYLLHRRITGEGSPLLGGKRDPARAGPTDLEAFIAAYRSGKISPDELQGSGAQPAPKPGAPQPDLAPAPGPAAPAPTAAFGGDAEPRSAPLLRPEVKLAYLTLRAALRDHHVFPNVRLSDLGRGEASGKVDLLICDAKFAMIAAVDVIAAGGQADPTKTALLREAGIRYLRFSTASMPKPADIHTLIYRA
jgi:hypothetical protein